MIQYRADSRADWQTPRPFYYHWDLGLPPRWRRDLYLYITFEIQAPDRVVFVGFPLDDLVHLLRPLRGLGRRQLPPDLPRLRPPDAVHLLARLDIRLQGGCPDRGRPSLFPVRDPWVRHWTLTDPAVQAHLGFALNRLGLEVRTVPDPPAPPFPADRVEVWHGLTRLTRPWREWLKLVCPPDCRRCRPAGRPLN